ncbi:MAG TPA: DUF2059 domain-containing protein [Thermoanaerobaculia bacterium]|nr:DUF2059 domain-containing protein [Thermoanaerobaculia bacterium]
MRQLLSIVLLIAVAIPLSATEPNPSARQRELIEQLLDSTGQGKQGNAMMDSMFALIEKQFLDEAAANGDDSAAVEEGKEMFALFRERIAKIDVAGLMREATIRIYAKYFTESELVDLTAFYQTPTGKKSIAVMPDLVREGMEAGVQYVAPKIDEVMTEVREVQEKKRPWRRTMSDIRTVSTAIEAYAMDNENRYPIGDYASLKEVLAPAYVAEFPEKDIWGNAYAYAASPDGAAYRLVSAGADGNFEWDSRRIAAKKDGAEDEEAEIRYRERLEDDVVFESGHFLQLPIQARPKNDQ